MSGRGAKDSTDDGRYAGPAGVFDVVDSDGSKSKEGWVIFVTGVHEEASEDDVLDKFNDFGKVRNINLNLDRQTGFAKGYALIEYSLQSEAEAAIQGMNGQALLGKEVRVTYTFVGSGGNATSERERDGSGGGGGKGGGRSEGGDRRRGGVKGY